MILHYCFTFEHDSTRHSILHLFSLCCLFVLYASFVVLLFFFFLFCLQIIFCGFVFAFLFLLISTDLLWGFLFYVVLLIHFVIQCFCKEGIIPCLFNHDTHAALFTVLNIYSLFSLSSSVLMSPPVLVILNILWNDIVLT